MHNNELEEITREDFRGLSKLKQLVVFSNRIQVIESDLFMHTPSLIALSIWDNQIKHVGYNAFDQLHGLSTIYFDNNICFSHSVNDDRTAAELLICRLFRSCPARALTSDKVDEQIESENTKVKELEEKVKRLERQSEILQGGQGRGNSLSKILCDIQYPYYPT